MLYVVSAPIGNLEDITLRAVETLKSVDVIACEDTRVTKRLLVKYGIINRYIGGNKVESKDLPNSKSPNSNVQKPSEKTNNSNERSNSTISIPRLISYHQHSGLAKTEKIIMMLKEGKTVALVTDAGTPGISDPGQKLIAGVISNGIEIISIPGPTAFVSALSISGFDTSGFVFIGFLPHKKGRQSKLQDISVEKRTVVLYESVHRIKKLLREISEIMPERELCICRELTKKFEEIYRGKASKILCKVIEKGEFTVVIGDLR